MGQIVPFGTGHPVPSGPDGTGLGVILDGTGPTLQKTGWDRMGQDPDIKISPGRDGTGALPVPSREGPLVAWSRGMSWKVLGDAFK